MNSFDHERMDVYKVAIEFIALADEVTENMPRGRAYLTDQLRRACTSVALNIAEGAGEFLRRREGPVLPDGKTISHSSVLLFSMSAAASRWPT